MGIFISTKNYFLITSCKYFTYILIKQKYNKNWQHYTFCCAWVQQPKGYEVTLKVLINFIFPIPNIVHICFIDLRGTKAESTAKLPRDYQKEKVQIGMNKSDNNLGQNCFLVLCNALKMLWRSHEGLHIYGIPIRYLLVQSQQWKHQKNVWNLLKI